MAVLYIAPWVACAPIQPDLPSSSLLSTSTIAKLASETPAGRQRRRVRVHAINLGQTLPIGFFMAATASGLDAAMPQKQPSHWGPWRTTLWLWVTSNVLLVRCRTVDRTRAPSEENGRKTNLNRPSRASCACLACCWSPLACTQCVVSPRSAVIRGRYTFSKKSMENKGC